MRPEYTADFIYLFWNKVDRSGGPDACWPWMGAKSRNGYGHVQQDAKGYVASRIAIELFGVILEPKQDCCHKCDNPPCCNPFHLFAGSRADNVRDMMLKDRRRYERGERHHSAKITKEDVFEIRRRFDSGEPLKGMAEKFGLCKSQIWMIATRRSWTHI